MIFFLSAPEMFATMLLALLLDRCCGEVRRFHPLVGFGRLASAIEKRMNGRDASRWRGAWAWALAVVPLSALSYFLVQSLQLKYPILALVAHALILYFCLGLQSLTEHALVVARALQASDLVLARRLTSYMVSRDTAQLNEEDLVKATVESVLENGCDAVFASLFWFAILGAPGAILARLSNTLDAMWGYRSQRYLRFGCVAARVDDVLHFIPARLTALSYALAGHTASAIRCWRLQAAQWSSPNAGPVMAAGAGALRLQLGGAAIYQGELEMRPILGLGATAQTPDIERALRLLKLAVLLWIAVGMVLVLWDLGA